MAKNSADYYNEATDYTKKAEALSKAKNELSSNIIKIVEKLNTISNLTSKISSVISTTDDSLLSEMSLRNEEMNLAIGETINKISTDEKSACEAIDKDIRNYENLAKTAMDNYRTVKASENIASGAVAGGINSDGIGEHEVKVWI